MVPTGNKTTRLSSFNHFAKTINHHVTLFDQVIKGHVTLWVGAPHPKSPLCQV